MKEELINSRTKENKINYRAALVLMISSMLGVGYLTLP